MRVQEGWWLGADSTLSSARAGIWRDRVGAQPMLDRRTLDNSTRVMAIHSVFHQTGPAWDLPSIWGVGPFLDWHRRSNFEEFVAHFILELER